MIFSWETYGVLDRCNLLSHKYPNKIKIVIQIKNQVRDSTIETSP